MTFGADTQSQISTKYLAVSKMKNGWKIIFCILCKKYKALLSRDEIIFLKLASLNSATLGRLVI
jgi:hypothetical protein